MSFTRRCASISAKRKLPTLPSQSQPSMPGIVWRSRLEPNREPIACGEHKYNRQHEPGFRLRANTSDSISELARQCYSEAGIGVEAEMRSREPVPTPYCCGA